MTMTFKDLDAECVAINDLLPDTAPHLEMWQANTGVNLVEVDGKSNVRVKKRFRGPASAANYLEGFKDGLKHYSE